MAQKEDIIIAKYSRNYTCLECPHDLANRSYGKYLTKLRKKVINIEPASSIGEILFPWRLSSNDPKGARGPFRPGWSRARWRF
jgi:hypothetical protein